MIGEKEIRLKRFCDLEVDQPAMRPLQRLRRKAACPLIVNQGAARN
jgi:hypothetical protein